MSAAVETPSATASTPPPGAGSADTGSLAPEKADADLTWDDLRQTPEAERAPTREAEAVKAWLAKSDEDEPTEKEPAEKREPKAAKEEPAATRPAASKPADTAKAEPPATPQARVVKVKLRGEERELGLDKVAALVDLPVEVLEAMPAEKVAHLYQRVWHGEDEARSRAKLEQEVETLFKNVRGNPLDVLDEIVKRAEVGTPFKELALQYVARDLERQALPPAERELLELREKVARQEAETQRILDEHKRQAEAQRRASFAAELDQEMRAAIAESKLPEGFALDRITALLQREKAERGANYEPMRSRDEMRRRAASHIPQLEKELEQAIEAFAERKGPEWFAQRFEKLYHALGDMRVAVFRKNSAAQTQARSESSEERAAPRNGHDLSWDALDKEIREVLAKA